MLYTAAALVAFLGIAHSLLGERYILVRLFKRDLPKVLGNTEFTRRTLRFAWHLTTVLALGIAALLVQLAGGAPPRSLVHTAGWTLVLAGLLPLIHTRGVHLSWIVLMTAGGLCIAGAAL